MAKRCKKAGGPCSDVSAGDPGFVDPRIALCFYSQSYRDIPVGANVVTRIALNNPNRVVLGIAANFATGTGNAAPWSDPGTVGGIAISPNSLILINMTELSVLTCGEWYGTLPAAGTWRIIEVVQRIGRRPSVYAGRADRREANTDPRVRLSPGGGGPVINPG